MEDGIISTNGRIRRSTYLLRWACIKIPYWIISAILIFSIFFGSLISIELDPSGTNFMMLMLFSCVYLVIYIIQLALLLPQIAKRLHDMNKSGWLALIYFLSWIPYIGLIFGLIFFLILITVDGTVGDNQYGEDPKQRVPYVYETNKMRD